MGCLFGFVVVVQTILHYLGWIGILLGLVALLFGNIHRGIELLVGGISFIVLKYIIGILFMWLFGSRGPRTVRRKQSRGKETGSDIELRN